MAMSEELPPPQKWMRPVDLELNSTHMNKKRFVVYLAFLLKAVNFRERVLQRGLVARIYYKVKKRGVIFFLLAYSCIAAKCNRG